MSFKEFFQESMEEKEVSEEEAIEIGLGLEEEAVHKELYQKFQTWAEENKLELPMTEEEFLMDIVMVHLKENPTEYSDALKCKEEKSEEETEEEKGVVKESSIEYRDNLGDKIENNGEYILRSKLSTKGYLGFTPEDASRPFRTQKIVKDVNKALIILGDKLKYSDYDWTLNYDAVLLGEYD